MENLKKKGRIEISTKIINEEWATLSLLFAKFFPYYIDQQIRTNTYTYYGFSSDFRELKEGELIPQYTAEIAHDNGGFTVKFTEV